MLVEGRLRTLYYDLNLPSGKNSCIFSGQCPLRASLAWAMASNSLALKYHLHPDNFKLPQLASPLSPNGSGYCLLQSLPVSPNSPGTQEGSKALPSNTPNSTQCPGPCIPARPPLKWPESLQRPLPSRPARRSFPSGGTPFPIQGRSPSPGIPQCGLCLPFCPYHSPGTLFVTAPRRL